MKEATTFTLPMKPIRAWTHLSDLRAFVLWHPSYRFRGDFRQGGRVRLTLLLFNGEMPLNVDATITRFDKPDRLAWLAGMSGILAMNEEYVFDAVGGGTQIRHSVELRGLLGPLAVFARRRLRRALRRQDEALIHYLKKETRGGGVSFARHHRRVEKVRPPAGATNV